MHTTVRAFLNWLNTLPAPYRHQLARTYWLMSAETTAEMTRSPEEAERLWRRRLEAPDFPLRKVAALIQMRGVVDFLLSHPELLHQHDPAPGTRPIEPIAPHHWERIAASWRQVRHQHLSDQALQDLTGR